MAEERKWAAADREFRPDAVISGGLSAFFRNFLGFSLIAFVIHLPIYAGIAVLAASGLEISSPGDAERVLFKMSMFRFFDVGANLVLNPIIVGALVYGVVQELRGKPVGLGEAVTVGFRRMLPCLAVGLLQGLLVMAGAILCIIPGCIWASTYWLAVPASVIERPGVGAAFQRSKTLTAGLRWKVFSVLFLVGLINFALGFVIGLATSRDEWSPNAVLTQMVLAAMVGTLSSAWGATTAAVGYFQIRRMKENVDVEELAAVFA